MYLSDSFMSSGIYVDQYGEILMQEKILGVKFSVSVILDNKVYCWNVKYPISLTHLHSRAVINMNLDPCLTVCRVGSLNLSELGLKKNKLKM